MTSSNLTGQAARDALASYNSRQRDGVANAAQSARVVAQADTDLRDRTESLNIRQMARAEELVKEIDGVSIGYIGNVYLDGTDDRSWRIFLPHPGRVGTSADCLGGFPTHERGKLLPLLIALKAGFDLARKGPDAIREEPRYRPVVLPHF